MVSTLLTNYELSFLLSNVLDGNVSSVLSLLLGRLFGKSEQGSRASTRHVYLARLSVSLLRILDATALLQFSRMNNVYKYRAYGPLVYVVQEIQVTINESQLSVPVPLTMARSLLIPSFLPNLRSTCEINAMLPG